MYNISRTTVRHILQHLSACGVLTLVGKNYVIARKPEQNDGFDCITASLKEQNRLFEQAFFTMINLRQLRAGESFFRTSAGASGKRQSGSGTRISFEIRSL